MACDEHSSDARTRLILVTLVAVYLAATAGLAAFGHFVFLNKTVLVPVLFVVAALSGRTRLFARDWAVFLSLVVLFDAVRGYIFALITAFDLPVYLGYVVDLERAATDGSLLPVALQRLWFDGARIGALEQFFVVVHASHFVFFFTVALFVWFLRHDAFWRFAAGLVAVMYLGLLCYLLVPTVPPWMAHGDFGAIEPLTHISFDVYNSTIPALRETFDVNPVAAMPSLHAGFPLFCSLAAIRLFGQRAWWTLAYTLLVALAVCYLGEHYLVDVLAGWALAAAAYTVAFHTEALERVWARLAPGGASARDRAPWSLRASLLVAALFLVAAELLGRQRAEFATEFVPPPSFVARELDGKSPLADYHRARRALRDGDNPLAQTAAERAIPKADDPELAEDAAYIAGRSAFANGDYATAAARLGGLDPARLSTEALVELAVALDRTGARERSGAAFDLAGRRSPDDPTLLYWRTRLAFERRVIGEDQVLTAISHLREHPNRGVAGTLADELSAVLGAAR